MAARLTNYAVHKLLEHMTAKTAYTPVATMYMGLSISDPGDAATGASCGETANSNGYARTAFTFAAAANRAITNSALIRFPNATGSYASPITHWTILDNATYAAGNVLAYGAFTTPLSPILGKYIRVPASGCNISLPITTGMGLCDTRVNNLLDLMFRNTAFTVAAVYCRLSSNVPTELGTFTEIIGTGYAPVAHAGWSTAATREIHNVGVITFGPPTDTWVQAVACLLSLSTVTLTDAIAYDAINFVDMVAVNSDTVTIADSAFSISIA